MDLPALVAEVPLELAADARLRVRDQAGADGPIEVADRLHQADIPHLYQVLCRLGVAQVRSHAGPDQALVAGDKQIARRHPPLAGPRRRLHDAQQRPVIQPGQVLNRPVRRGEPTRPGFRVRYCS
jgi:hypothetical protein